MRPAKVPGEVVYQKGLYSLCRRMDPKTHLVRPSWLTMMREIGVCRLRIADAITELKAEGKLEVVTTPRKGGKKGEIEYWYEVKMQHMESGRRIRERKTS